MKTYKATITPTVSGGNIEVSVTANSVSQAIGLMKTLPFFKSFVKQPTMVNELTDNLTKLQQLSAQAQAKTQAKLAGLD